MKNWQISGILVLLIFGFILMSGCTSKSTSSVTVTVTPTPTPTPTPTQTPMVTLITPRTFTPTPTPTPTPTITLCKTKCNDRCLTDYEDICAYEKLKKQGYSDCIDCMRNYNDPVCKNIDRYNAEVDAKNECNGFFK
jgi:hypothetical protein